ncbi:MAG: DUF4199 domain-containing protein [Bacteroidetes bacterium]|nr:DUF4199 domain-containing protein [Bacteroidota bacterium]
METNQPSVIKHSLNYGAILGAIVVLYSLLLYGLDAMMNQALGYISFILLLGGIIYGIKQYRDKLNNGFISFGTGFKTGFFMIIVSGLIGSVYTFLFFQFFDPGMIQQMLKHSEEQLVHKYPNMDDAQIQQMLKYSAMFMKPWSMAIFGFFMNVIVGGILSLIVAAVMKKEENPMQSAL